MAQRTKPIVEFELPREQAGFRKGRGTRDQIANMRWMLEKVHDSQQTAYLFH